jgi:hypothetical protein
VFLGTPHGALHKERLYNSCLFLVRQYAESGKLSNQQKANLKENVELWNIARRFGSINIRVQILNVFEETPTKTKKRTNYRFQKPSQIVSF